MFAKPENPFHIDKLAGRECVCVLSVMKRLTQFTLGTSLHKLCPDQPLENFVSVVVFVFVRSFRPNNSGNSRVHSSYIFDLQTSGNRTTI